VLPQVHSPGTSSQSPDRGRFSPTDAGNCECLCNRHHHLKHEAGWTVTGNPNDELTWTSPTGHTYRAPPGHYDLPDHEQPAAARRPEPDAPDEPPPF
jgi:hypothetical protein